MMFWISILWASLVFAEESQKPSNSVDPIPANFQNSSSAPVAKIISNRATLVEASKTISTLNIKNKTPEVVPNFSVSPPLLEVELSPVFNAADWSLVYQGEPVEWSDEKLKLRLPITQKVQEFEFIGVGPYGEVEQMTLGVVVEDFDELTRLALEEEKQRNLRKKRRLLGMSARLGVAQGKVFGASVSDESALGGLAQISSNYRLGNEGLSERLSLANITKVYGPTQSFMRADLRAVYAFFNVDATFQIYANVGGYFSRILNSSQNVQLSTIQLEMYPSFRLNLPQWGKGAMLLGLIRYFPVSPSTSPSGGGSESELDLEYLLPEGFLFKRKRISFGFNYYNLKAVKSSQEAGFQAMSLFAAIRF